MVCLIYKWQFTIKGSQGWNLWKELKYRALIISLPILCSIWSLCATQDHLPRSDPHPQWVGPFYVNHHSRPHSIAHRKTWWKHFSRQVSLSQMTIAYVMLPTKNWKHSLYLMERKINTNIFSLSIVIQENSLWNINHDPRIPYNLQGCAIVEWHHQILKHTKPHLAYIPT